MMMSSGAHCAVGWCQAALICTALCFHPASGGLCFNPLPLIHFLLVMWLFQNTIMMKIDLLLKGDKDKKDDPQIMLTFYMGFRWQIVLMQLSITDFKQPLHTMLLSLAISNYESRTLEQVSLCWELRLLLLLIIWLFCFLTDWVLYGLKFNFMFLGLKKAPSITSNWRLW